MAEREPVPVDPARYAQLTEAVERNRRGRAPAVEEFRLWAAALHPEAATVEDALRACTPAELYQAVRDIPPVRFLSTPAAMLCYAALLRLEERAAAAEAARANVSPEPVMPEEVDWDG